MHIIPSTIHEYIHSYSANHITITRQNSCQKPTDIRFHFTCIIMLLLLKTIRDIRELPSHCHLQINLFPSHLLQVTPFSKSTIGIELSNKACNVVKFCIKRSLFFGGALTTIIYIVRILISKRLHGVKCDVRAIIVVFFAARAATYASS